MVGKKFDRRGSGPMFWVLLVFVVFVMYSVSVAAVTADDCGKGAPKTWHVFPPAWECDARLPGYG